MKTQIKTFPSGLELVNIYDKTKRSAVVYVAVKTGTVNDDEKVEGISHFVEHMMFKGTKTRNFKQIIDEFANCGALNNASTSKLVTSYYAMAMSKYTEKICELISDMLVNSTFPEEEIEKERKVILEEIAKYADENDSLVDDISSTEYFKGHKLSKDILGPKEIIQKITRADLIDYVNKYYTSDRIVVFIAGNINLKEAEHLCNKYFEGKFNKSNGIEVLKNHKLKHSAYVHVYKESQQSQIQIMLNADRKISLGIEGSVIRNILGRGMNSRLFQEIREKNGLAYYVESSTSNYQMASNFEVIMGTNMKNSKMAIELTKKVIIDYIENGITQEELDREVTTALTAAISLDESLLNRTYSIASYYLKLGKIRNLNKLIKKMENLQVEDINKKIKKYFDLSNVVIGYVGEDPACDLLEIWNNQK